jgi:hypothetical protein
VQCSAVQCSAVQCSAGAVPGVQCSAVQCSTGAVPGAGNMCLCLGMAPLCNGGPELACEEGSWVRIG